MPKLEEQLNEQTLKGTVSVNDQNLQQALIETAVLDDLNDVNISSPTNAQILGYQASTNTWQNVNVAIPNGDKGDITTSGGGSTWTIDNNAVTEAKINTGAVTETKLGTGAVTETKIADSAVTENKIANNAVTVNKIANDTVTNSKLANMATATVKGRATAGTGDPEDLAIDNDLSTVSANDDTIPSAKAVKAYVDILDLKTRIRNGGLINGKIVPSVASNNLTVAIKTLAGTDPSASNPVGIWIGDTLRWITSSLSISANAGTNYLEAGSAELATREIDYFVSICWNTTGNNPVLLMTRTIQQIFGNYVNNNTAAKGRITGGSITSIDSFDSVTNIGRFAATLSAGAGYTWSVPAFTSVNLIQEPIYETRWLVWLPTLSASASMTWTAVSRNVTYKLIGDTMHMFGVIGGTTGGTASFGLQFTIPLAMNEFSTAGVLGGPIAMQDGGGTSAGAFEKGDNSSEIQVRRYDAGNFGLGANRVARVSMVLPI